MVVVMKERATETEVEAVIAQLVEQGMDVHRSTGASRIVLGVVGGGKVDPDWRAAFLEFPDRFMVGIDDMQNWDEYDAVARNIRMGLLANLDKDVAEKVAWRNAAAWFAQHDQAHPITVILQEVELVEHRVARNLTKATDDDVTDFTFGVYSNDLKRLSKLHDDLPTRAPRCT